MPSLSAAASVRAASRRRLELALVVLAVLVAQPVLAVLGIPVFAVFLVRRRGRATAATTALARATGTNLRRPLSAQLNPDADQSSRASIGAAGSRSDGDRVLALTTITARGKGSGVPVLIRAADLWTVRDGKIFSLVGYTDRAEALEAVGLREQAMSQKDLEVVRRLARAFTTAT